MGKCLKASMTAISYLVHTGTGDCTLGTREESIVSTCGALGTREYSVVSALGTLGLARTQSCQLVVP